MSPSDLKRPASDSLHGKLILEARVDRLEQAVNLLVERVDWLRKEVHIPVERMGGDDDLAA